MTGAEHSLSGEPRPCGPSTTDTTRVQTPMINPACTAESIRRAQRALVEIAARDAVDQARAEEERATKLARWHADDHPQDSDERGNNETVER